MWTFLKRLFQMQAQSLHLRCSKNFPEDEHLTAHKDISLVLLQIQSMPVGIRIPGPATILFNRPIEGLLPKMNREPIDNNKYDVHYEAHQKIQ